jgi:IclR family transcriptional regulator, acetate operon repressor
VSTPARPTLAPVTDQPPSQEPAAARPGSVEKALDVLLHLAAAQADDQGVTEIAEAVGLPKASVHRLLGSLRSRDFVSVDPVSRRYALGPAVLSLGTSYLNRLDVRRLARSAMTVLSQRTEETVTLSVRTGWTAAYVDEVRPQRDIAMSVLQGEAFPLHAGASSKAFLAFLAEEERERYLRSLDAPAAEIHEELASIREHGFAQTQGERDSGAASVAAPLLDRDGVPVAVISVCGPVDRFWPQAAAHARDLLETTATLSQQLGHRRA